jgi:predicted P-loop ATPase
MDTMLILKSKQGTKKSSLFRLLAPANRFSSAHLEFGSKDSRMSFQQNTWIEIAELSAYQKKDIQLVKAEITERSDDFRLPYGHSSTKNPRHCILLGSTNDDKFLRDPTGSRRFWIITVDDTKQADLIWLEKNKDALWAEIVALYRAAATCQHCAEAVDGELRCPTHRWWLSKEEDVLREKINEVYTETEPYIAWLQDWLANHIATKNSTKQGMHASHKNTDALKIYELLQEVGLSSDKCHERAQQNRMVVALKACGYIKRHTRNGEVWISPGMQGRPSLTVAAPPPPVVAPQPVSAPASVDGEELKKTADGDELIKS